MEDRNLITGKDLERHFELNSALFDFTKLFPYEAGDDRTIVIVGASFIDYVLEHILRSFFPNEETEVDTLLTPEQALGTYGSRVRMIFCLGFIDKIVKDDLKLIGKIRNKFAHDLYASFDDNQIKSWCHQLRWHREATLTEVPSNVTSRDIYQVGVNHIVGYLNGIVGIARAEKRKIRKDQ